MLLKISQNSQESTRATVCFLIKLTALGQELYKKKALAQAFSCEF